MEIAIFILYLAFFCYILSTVPFFKTSGIGTLTLIILFIIKILAGFAYAKFYTLPKYYQGSDTWRFYRLSRDETRVLLHNPTNFLKDLFSSGYSQRGNIFSGENTYWNDLKSNVIIKLMAVFNVLTNSSYYTNIIFFNFLFLFGLVALFRVFYQRFPREKTLIIWGLFLVPSTLFWCSGIHKDGLILSAAGIIIYVFNNYIKDGFSAKRTLILVLGLLVIFTLRNYVVFALFPALLSWDLCKKYQGKNIRIFLLVYSIGMVLFFSSSTIPQLNFLSFLANKQHEFLQLEGNSKVNIPALHPTVTDFILFLPHALDMAFARPHWTEIKSFTYVPPFIENVLLLLLLLISLIYSLRVPIEPFLLFLYFFSLSILLLSGYTIPFTGAIVRYKSFILPLIVTPLLCSVSDAVNQRRKNGKTGNRDYFKKVI